MLTIFFYASLLLLTSAVYSRQDEVSHNIRALLKKMQPVDRKGLKLKTPPAGDPKYGVAKDGYLTHLIAQPSHHFPAGITVPGKPEETARNFLDENRQALGAENPRVKFRSVKSTSKNGRNFEKFIQTYADVPVFGTAIIVQLNETEGIEYVSSDIARHLEVFDRGDISFIPGISGSEAISIVKGLLTEENPEEEIETSLPELKIFDASVLDSDAGQHLVWDLKARSTGSNYINENILLDAHTGVIVRRYPLNIPALNRNIYNANNNHTYGTLMRSEGDPATGDPEVDNAYILMGDAYNYFMNQHGRDSFDNDGRTIQTTVRYCHPDYGCPMNNAYFSECWWNIFCTDWFYFGEGYIADDIVSHEFTHGVTAYASGLIYENQSGAINDSFSDIWGEFIDLTNGKGTDTPAVKWELGEDSPGGAFRNMKDPAMFNDPDRMGSPNYYTGTGDHGGVHTNSGVGNKLAYLLTDGDTFNGQTVSGLGISRIADLYYAVNTYLLGFSANYRDLYYALVQAAINLGWTSEEKNNLYRACTAVEISEEKDIYVDKNNYCGFPSGEIVCTLVNPDPLWPVYEGGPYVTVTTGVNNANPGDHLHIKTGSYNEAVIIDKILTINAWDGPAVIGQ